MGPLTIFFLFALFSSPHAASRESSSVMLDFDRPDTFLAQGSQTSIAPGHLAELGTIGVRGRGLSDIRRIVEWKKGFQNETAGGRWVGIQTVNGILEQRRLTGCHDHALLLVAVLRHFGFPSLLIDCAGLSWARDFPEKRRDYSGHVFVLTHVEGAWILLDSTSDRYLSGFDPRADSFRFPVGNEEYFGVLFRGRDPADYGVSNLRALNGVMERYAASSKGRPSAPVPANEAPLRLP
jgi:hypothetical protein